jgi:thiol-disulfide isomerase/thioredoxin
VTPSSKLLRQNARLLIAALVLTIGIIVMWQAGLIFSSGEGKTSTGQTLQAASVNLMTPNPAGLTVGLSEGQLAPDFEFSAFDGRRMRLSDLRGRVVLLNFWATWCIPCRAELPDLEALQQRYGDQIAIVAMNNGEALGQASSFIDKLGVKLTAFGFDQKSDVAKRYGIQGLPVSYFIDSQGIITRVIAGQMSPKVMESGASEALTGIKQN